MHLLKNMPFRMMLASALLFSSVIFSRSAQAQTNQNVINGDLTALVKLFNAQPEKISKYGIRREKIKPVSLYGSIAGQGRVEVTFNSKRNVTWSSELVYPFGRVAVDQKILLLRGQLYSARAKASTPIAALIYKDNNIKTLELTFQNNRSLTHAIRSYYHLSMQLKGEHFVSSADYELKKIPQFALATKSCGDTSQTSTQALTTTPTTTPAGSNTPPPTLAAVTKLAEVSVEGDYQYAVKSGSSSKASAKISGVINAAEAIYERDLGITFEVKKVNIISSASADYSSSEASALLEQFQYTTIQKKQLGSADDYILVSGKLFTDTQGDKQYTTIGLAYLGVVCYAPTYSYGIISKVSDSIDYITFAHEMGHNFGAEHDTTTNSLMSPVAAPGQSAFSTFSKNQIADFLAKYGTCLTAVTGNPTTTTTTTSRTTTTGGGNSGGGGNNGGSSGGSGGSAGANLSGREVSFDAFLTRAGRFSYTSAASGTLSEGCTVKVVASNNTWFKTKQVLYTASGTTTMILLSATINRKALAATSKGGTKLFIRDEYTCPNEEIFEASTWVAINPGAIRNKSKAVSVNKWLSLLKRGIAK